MTTHEQTASSDLVTAEEIRTHHAAMVSELDRRSDALRQAGHDQGLAAREALADWFHDVLVPHADEEEGTTYRAAGGLPEGRLLIEAMVREHELIKRLVRLFHEAEEPAAAAAYGRAVFEAFVSHQGKENEIILPLLVEAPNVTLTGVIGKAHGHQVGEHAHHPH